MVEPTPKIIIDNVNQAGRHNEDLNKSIDRIIQGSTYKDLSTICIVPIVGVDVVDSNGKVRRMPYIHAKVTQNWMGLMTAMNNKFIRIFMMDLRVDDAYNQAIEMILNNPELSKWSYILTLEQDNMPPADGLIRLYEAINKGYDVVQGLYWTKGELGQPMIYGNPEVTPLNFIPQIPQPNTIQRCNGLGMGFNLFKLEMFKDTKLRKPWFRTQQEVIPNQGAKAYTQDLYFYEDAGRNGYKFACHTGVKVGHYDASNDIIW